MALLVVTTILWAFSFSLIGEYLAGTVDSYFSTLMRTGLAALVFLPFLRFKGYDKKVVLWYMLAGMLQLGIMYLFTFHAYLYLTVAEFLLFNVLTPLYITLIYDLLNCRAPRLSYAASALLAVAGAAIVRYDKLTSDFWWGLLLVQLANFSFALGMVSYKRLMEVYPVPQHQAFSWFYCGAFGVGLLAWLVLGNWQQLPATPVQWGVLIWLGVVASGVGYFMWNYGATQVDAGTLCIMNNMHIPAGLLVNFIIWQQSPQWYNFIAGSVLIIVALLLHRRWIVTEDGK